MNVNGFVVFQSDFGMEECTVVQCSGVAHSLAKNADKFYLEHACHDITPFNIGEASFRIRQALHAWDEGTTYVSVIDPTVGSDRQSVVALTNDNKYIVTPNNGALTDIQRTTGIKSLREIDDKHRRAPDGSATFDGRDLYIPVAVLLATKQMQFEEVGRELNIEDVVLLPENLVSTDEQGFHTNVSILDKHFGHLWTDICVDEFSKKFTLDQDKVRVVVTKDEQVLFDKVAPFGTSFFSAGGHGLPIVYTTELRKIGVGLDTANLAQLHGIQSGTEYKISFTAV